MPIAIKRFSHVASWHDHAVVAAITMATVVVGVTALMVDRRPPVEYIATDITPRAVYPGGTITIHRHVVWHRKCEGTALTEVVSADRIVTNYDRNTRSPYELGDTRADRTIALPKTIAPGTTTYRGVLKFPNCGLTSRWWPIEVPYQEVTFEVR